MGDAVFHIAGNKSEVTLSRSISLLPGGYVDRQVMVYFDPEASGTVWYEKNTDKNFYWLDLHALASGNAVILANEHTGNIFDGEEGASGDVHDVQDLDSAPLGSAPSDIDVENELDPSVSVDQSSNPMVRPAQEIRREQSAKKTIVGRCKHCRNFISELEAHNVCSICDKEWDDSSS